MSLPSRDAILSGIHLSPNARRERVRTLVLSGGRQLLHLDQATGKIKLATKREDGSWEAKQLTQRQAKPLLVLFSLKPQ